MQHQPTFNDATDDSIELISLADLVATIWRGRWTIFIITLVVSTVGLSGSLLSATYQSQGFFRFGGPIPKDQPKPESATGITLADYKRFAASYGASDRFADFVQDKKLDSIEGIKGLRNAFLSSTGISKFIEPIYTFTKSDAKELIGQPQDTANHVVGLRINYASSSPHIAQQMVGVLGRYAMDSIIYYIYFDTLHFKPDEIRTKLITLDNVIIANRTQLEEYQRKVADLKQIIAQNGGGATDQGVRQVITIAEDNARYLPPVTLLMATEVQASAANEAILKARREQQQHILLLEYYERAKLMLNTTKSGEAVLHKLETLKTAVFRDKDLDDDMVKEVYNRITVDNQTSIDLYLNKSRFIAGPTLPEHSTARPTIILALSVLLGLFLALVFVFGRKWWKDHREQLAA